MPRWPRLLTILLFACALALRAWVPAGWMPTPGAHDFSIMPCPAASGASMADMDHGPDDRHHTSGNGDCFSPLLAGAALPAGPPQISAPASVHEPVQPTLAPAAFKHSPPALPPPSTGPPEIA